MGVVIFYCSSVPRWQRYRIEKELGVVLPVTNAAVAMTDTSIP